MCVYIIPDKRKNQNKIAAKNREQRNINQKVQKEAEKRKVEKEVNFFKNKEEMDYHEGGTRLRVGDGMLRIFTLTG